MIGLVNLDDEEMLRLMRVRIAMKLKITPAQVDAMPADDVADMLAVMKADKEYAAHQRRKR